MPLRSVFSILPGIGPVRQAQLHARGLRDWSELRSLDAEQTLFGSPLDAAIAQAEERFEARDPLYFSRRLPGPLAYLVALTFPELITFLDIEATGLSRFYHTITLIGWNDGPGYEFQLVGRDARPGPEFLDHVERCPIVVTFNGSLYDLPFLRSRGPLPEICHVDLRYLAYRLGLSGGQKVVEEKLGIARPARGRELRGSDAPGLWFRACRSDAVALRKLLLYNYLDIRGMGRILKLLARRAAAADSIRVDRRSLGRSIAAITVPRRPAIAAASIERDLIPQIAGNATPLVTFAPSPGAARFPVVGVDLSGSAARPTGMAAISGNSVDVTTVDTDEAILDFIARHDAGLVSIDAPLCLPVGRTVVTDDDPARDSAGIMRLAERELRRRGVHVYPSLLPSMQRLTARGIELAARLRRQGIPTIESYPGAAQDILAMPRKGVGVEYLRRSLEETGLLLADRRLSHDELDAITSAVVGVLFMEDLYEALGPGPEDPMIVPRLGRQARPRSVIGVSGPISAGKTTVAEWIGGHAFHYGRYSMVVAAEAELRGQTPDRDVLQRLGDELHRSVGQRELGRRLLDMIGDGDRLVIDGLRFPSDVAFLRERFGGRFRHVHVAAGSDVRRARFVRGGGTAAGFEAAVAHPVESESGRLVEFADEVVPNEGHLSELYERLEPLLRPPTRPRWVRLSAPAAPSGRGRAPWLRSPATASAG